MVEGNYMFALQKFMKMLKNWIKSKVNFWVQSFHKRICDATYTIDEKFKYISGVKKKRHTFLTARNFCLARSSHLKFLYNSNPIFYTWVQNFIELWENGRTLKLVPFFGEFCVRSQLLCFTHWITTITQLQPLKLIAFACQYHWNPN